MDGMATAAEGHLYVDWKNGMAMRRWSGWSEGELLISRQRNVHWFRVEGLVGEQTSCSIAVPVYHGNMNMVCR